jgi:hypothetical protein
VLEGGAGLLALAGFLLTGGEPIEEHLQAHLPLLLLLLVPPVKGRFLAQPETVEEGTAYQGEGVLQSGHHRGTLLLRGNHRECLCFLPGLLHHIQVELEWGVWIQAKQVVRAEQMRMVGGRGRGRRVVEQVAQEGYGVAQRGARFVWLTVWPEEGIQLAPLMQAPFDGQVEQQRLRFAQGKAEAAAVMKHFGSPEHRQM